MKLVRVKGGLHEVLSVAATKASPARTVPTAIDQAFELADDQAKALLADGTGRFKEADGEAVVGPPPFDPDDESDPLPGGM